MSRLPLHPVDANDPNLRGPAITRDHDQRLATLERQLGGARRVFTPSAVSSLDLGALNGEAIMAVRLTFKILTSGTGGNTFLRIRPNGLSSISSGALGHFTSTGASPGYTPSYTPLFGGAITAGSSGLVIAGTNWTTSVNIVSGSGVFHTPIGTYRRYLGIYENEDGASDNNLRLEGGVSSVWGDSTTQITSLVLALDAGTFTGRVAMELI